MSWPGLNEMGLMNAEQGRLETELPQLRAFRSDLIVRFGPGVS